nr:cephalosporin hydroxylase family protein [Lysinibacillus sphaericus]
MNKYAKEAKTVLVILDSDHREEEHVLQWKL